MIIYADNSIERGQMLRTRRPSYTVSLESLYPPEKILDFYRNDGINELIGLPHHSLAIDMSPDPSFMASLITNHSVRAVIIDHEALREDFSGFWEDALVASSLAGAVRSGTTLFVGFQSSGYCPQSLLELLPYGKPWQIVSAGEADAMTFRIEAAGHPLAEGFTPGVAINWFCGDTWRALRNLGTTEPFNPAPQPTEYGSVAWLSVPGPAWRVIAHRFGRPEHVSIAECNIGPGRIILDQSLALHGTNIDAMTARRYARSLRTYLRAGALPVKSPQAGNEYLFLSGPYPAEHAPGKTVEYHGIPFRVYGDETMLCYTEGRAEVPVGTTVNRLYLLGCTLSWPHATGSWFVNATDFSQDYLIGDSAGNIRIEYTDNTRDELPLIMGWNFLWQQKLLMEGKEWLHPFDNEAIRTRFFGQLCLSRAEGTGIRAWIMEIVPRGKKILSIIIEGPSAKFGHPVFAAMTAVKMGGNLPAAPDSGKSISLPAKIPAPCSLRPMQRTLYTFPEDYEQARLEFPSDFDGAKIRFSGSRTADVLSCIYAVNMSNLNSRIHPRYGTFALNSGPRYGTYRSCLGAWCDGSYPEDWKPDGWSRDNGRAGIERMALGLHRGARKEIILFDTHLHCGSPPHMERTVSDMPATHEWQQVSLRGNPVRVAPENDGHGLITLYRANYLVHHPDDMDALWSSTVDYAEWICFLMENPFQKGQPTDTLYTVSECSGFGGIDIYSHALCRTALKACSWFAWKKGDVTRAERWERYAVRLSHSMSQYLIAGDPPCWMASPCSDWQSGSEALAPLTSLPDWSGYDLSACDPGELAINRNTYNALVSGKQWYARQRAIGYDHALVTQAALLLDDFERAEVLIDHLCRSIYSVHGPEPWVVAEGSVVHESENMWYRSGMGGNLIHLAETLKIVRLMAGIDCFRPGLIRVLPRLPNGISGISVSDYPLPPGCGGPATLSYEMHLDKTGIELNICCATPKLLDIRLGSLSVGRKIHTRINGKSVK